MRKQLLSLIFSTLLASSEAFALDEIDHHKKVIGPTADFTVDEQAEFLARIDTGAATTSIHAIDLEVEDAGEDMKDNIDKTIHFTLVNKEGKEWRTSARISEVKQVRNSQGVETRYLVPLRLGWDTINKTVDVNLRDRSSMEYKLLIGRDWMENEVVIDLERDTAEN